MNNFAGFKTSEYLKLEEENEDLRLQRDGQSITITELKTANREFTEDYQLQQKAINMLNDSGLKLMGENKELKSKLANQKYLDPQEVKKIFLDCREKPNIDIPQFHINAGKAITAICNLALPKIDRDRIPKAKSKQKYHGLVGKYHGLVG